MIKFTRTKYSSLEGDTKVRYSTGDDTPFTVEGSRRGMELTGTVWVESREDLDKLAEAIGKCYAEHQAMIPQLSRTLSGH